MSISSKLTFCWIQNQRIPSWLPSLDLHRCHRLPASSSLSSSLVGKLSVFLPEMNRNDTTVLTQDFRTLKKLSNWHKTSWPLIGRRSVQEMVLIVFKSCPDKAFVCNLFNYNTSEPINDRLVFVYMNFMKGNTLSGFKTKMLSKLAKLLDTLWKVMQQPGYCGNPFSLLRSVYT